MNSDQWDQAIEPPEPEEHMESQSDSGQLYQTVTIEDIPEYEPTSTCHVVTTLATIEREPEDVRRTENKVLKTGPHLQKLQAKINMN